MWFHVFLFDTNNLFTIIWFQVTIIIIIITIIIIIIMIILHLESFSHQRYLTETDFHKSLSDSKSI